MVKCLQAVVGASPKDVMAKRTQKPGIGHSERAGCRVAKETKASKRPAKPHKGSP